jgi:hypothetical protein
MNNTSYLESQRLYGVIDGLLMRGVGAASVPNCAANKRPSVLVLSRGSETYRGASKGTNIMLIYFRTRRQGWGLGSGGGGLSQKRKGNV